MPDENKIKKLASIGYVVQPVCGNCATFTAGVSGWWGSCSAHTYEHLKHGRRNLSVNAAGSCPDHRLGTRKKSDLEHSGFDRFLPEGK